jgi:DNA polymerase III epsilon subunit-like protein
MTPASPEAYVSVDVETAGPNPSTYSLLSIGACLVARPAATLYVELQPVNTNFTTEALAINGLSLERLAREGLPPTEALTHFEAWLAAEIPGGQQPIFVGFNAPFDWMFVADYFHRFLGHNPFGHTALDIKAFSMGLSGSTWQETSKRHLGSRYPGRPAPIHHALQDALEQAELFRHMLTEAAGRRSG